MDVCLSGSYELKISSVSECFLPTANQYSGLYQVLSHLQPFSESVTWSLRNKGKMNAYYFRRDKTAVSGAIKAQLPFSEGKYQLLNS